MYPEEQLPVDYLEGYLSDPSRVQRQINENLRDRTIADYAFGTGDAKQGAVIYDVVTGEVIEGDRDAEEIKPGANFPIITVDSSKPQLAKTDMFGGAVEMTWQAIKRNETDTWARRQAMLEKKVVKKINQVCLDAIINAPLQNELVLTDSWGDADVDIAANIFAGKSLIDDAELGYESDLAIINPLDAQAYLLGRKDVREQFPRESRDLNPILSGDIDGFAGLEWIKSNRVPRGQMYVLQRGVFGSVRYEDPQVQANIYDDNDRHVKIAQAWRSLVPIITDPKALTVIRGFGA